MDRRAATASCAAALAGSQQGVEDAHARGMIGLHREIRSMEDSMGARHTLPPPDYRAQRRLGGGGGAGERGRTWRDMAALAPSPPVALAASPPSSIRTISTKWDGIPVVVYAVRLDTPSVGAQYQHQQQQDLMMNRGGALYAFAFCKEGMAQPFALTGMRHLFYPFMPVAQSYLGDEEGQQPPEFGRGRREAEQQRQQQAGPMGLHRYPASRSQMVDDLLREASPFCPFFPSLAMVPS